MAKIENKVVYPLVTPTASDRIIGTDVSDNNKTVSFLISDLPGGGGGGVLQDLQSVLDVGNIAVQDMTLTGDVTVYGDVAPTTLTAQGSPGSAGQILSSTGTGLEWIDSPAVSCCSLDDVLSIGNTTSQDIFMTSGELTVQGSGGGINILSPAALLSTGVATFNNNVAINNALTFGGSGYLVAGGTPGLAGDVLVSTGTGVQWSSTKGACCGIQEVLTAGDTATDVGLTFAGTSTIRFGVNNNIVSAGTNIWTGSNSFHAAGTTATTAGIALSGSLHDGTTTGAAGQVLTSTSTGVEWADQTTGTQDLQSVLDNGNTASGANANITISGTLDATTITDGTGSTGISGQFLSSTATGLVWSDNATACCNLQDTLTVGNSATTSIVLSGTGISLTAPTVIPGLIEDGSGNTGAGLEILRMNAGATALEWASAATGVTSISANVSPITVSTGDPLLVSSPTGSIVLTPTQYNGASNVGYVPTGGSTGTYLDGDGNWTTPANSGVTSFSNINGTYISASTVNNLAVGDVTLGTLDLSATNDVATISSRVLTQDNTWAVPLYTTLTGATTAANSTGLTGALTFGYSSGTNLYTITSNYFDGGDNVGIVPTSVAIAAPDRADYYMDADGNWSIPPGTGAGAVTSVTAGAAGTSTGAVTTITPSTGAVVVTPNAYAGGSNVGHVPAGGGAGEYLDGASGVWTTLPTSVTSVDEKTPGTSTGVPIVVNPSTGVVEVQSMAYAGNTNVGHVPTGSGGTATLYLDGSGNWSTPTGSGAMNSFDITDGTTTETISNGDTIIFHSGTFVQAVVGATDVVSLDLSATGTPNATKFLRGDNTWTDLNTLINGTVNQIAMFTGTGQTVGDSIIAQSLSSTGIAIDSTGVSTSLDFTASGSDVGGILNSANYYQLGMAATQLYFLVKTYSTTALAINGSNGYTHLLGTSGAGLGPLSTLHVEGNITMTNGSTTAGAGKLIISDANGTGSWQEITGTTPINVTSAGSTVTISSDAYAGGSSIGYVPAGGTAGTYLEGDGTWSIPGGAGAGVTTFTNTSGTYISYGTDNAAQSGAVTTGTIDLSAVDGTAIPSTRFLSKDNTWDVPYFITLDDAFTTANTTGLDGALTFTLNSASNIYNVRANYFDGGANVGIVPDASTASAGDYLDYQGNWTSPSSSGVTSVTTTDGTFINLTPNTAATGAVTVTADLSAAGLGSPTTDYFLRGDNTWATLGSALVTSLYLGAPGTSTGLGDSLSLSAVVGSITLTPNQYDGGGNIGMVPTGGTSSTFLRGDGTWVTPAGGTMSSFDVSDDSTTQTVTDGQELNIVAGTGISSTLGAVPTDHTFTIANTGVTEIIAGTGVAISATGPGGTGDVTVSASSFMTAERTYYSPGVYKFPGSNNYATWDSCITSAHAFVSVGDYDAMSLSYNSNSPLTLTQLEALTANMTSRMHLFQNPPGSGKVYQLSHIYSTIATNLANSSSAGTKVSLYRASPTCALGTPVWFEVGSAPTSYSSLQYNNCRDISLDAMPTLDKQLNEGEFWTVVLYSTDSGGGQWVGNMRIEFFEV